MKLSDIGEREAIKIISSILTEAENTVGIGDDCAAVSLDEDFLLVSSDMINSETHVPKDMTSWQIGWFSTAVNLSDIAAKGGKPLGILLSLGLPRTLDDSFLRDLMKGADKCATTYDTFILGGDTKENPYITVAGTAFGMVSKNNFMARRGAKIGDIVAVTGTLGKAAVGYYSLKYGLKNKNILSKGLMEPKPRVKEGMALAESNAVSSSMDISDGFASSIYQLSELNSVGFEIDSSNLPIASELKDLKSQFSDMDMVELALYSGGDYELLVTVTPSMFEVASKSVMEEGCSLVPVGKVISSSENYVIANGKKESLSNEGYEHFVN